MQPDERGPGAERLPPTTNLRVVELNELHELGMQPLEVGDDLLREDEVLGLIEPLKQIEGNYRKKSWGGTLAKPWRSCVI